MTVYLFPKKEFKVQLLVQLRWKDPRLEYATKISKINVITGETTFLNQIWIPQIYLAAARESLFQGGQNKDNAVHILPDGTVLCTSRSGQDYLLKYLFYVTKQNF